MTPEEELALSLELKNQDNRITADPLFCVQQKRRVYGMDGDLIDDLDFIWVYTEDSEYTFGPDEIFDEIRDNDHGEDGVLNLHDEEIEPEEWGYHQMFYVEYWDFVCAHFTERAADEYIRDNNHNLTSPRVYVTSQYRCYEWNAVRKHLMRDLATVLHKCPDTECGREWWGAAADDQPRRCTCGNRMERKTHP